jgi:penicillin-insensitive murein endopeptidase
MLHRVAFVQYYASMGIWVAVLTIIAVTFSGCSSVPVNPWAKVVTPTSGKSPESIGGYSAGCLRGAVSLPPDGKGYQVMRLSRARFYAHPKLIQYLRDLGAQTSKWGRTLLVGDMGYARGGPFSSGHRSHQIGLDVDIWYLRSPDADKRSLTLEERETLGSPVLVNADRTVLAPDFWTFGVDRILAAAAASDDVERIFVNPRIK